MSKRVKISFKVFTKIRTHPSVDKNRQLYFLREFQTESGLLLTSYIKDVYYFKIEDKQKYFLSKITYGF